METASLHCQQLMDSLHQYMAVNMETLLEARLLDELSPWHIKQLSSAVQGHQAAKSPFSRLQLPVSLATSVNVNREWLAMQDTPHPIVRSQPKAQPKRSPKTRRRSSRPASPGTPSKPNIVMPLTPLLANTSEDLFCMDEALVPPLNLNLDEGVSASAEGKELGNTPKLGPWKAKSLPKYVSFSARILFLRCENLRVDMKAVLAEAEEIQASSASGRTQHPRPPASPLTPVHRQRSGDGIHVSFSLPKTHDVPPQSSSPGSSRSTSTPAWRMPNPSLLSALEPPSLSPGRSSATLARIITPPGSMQVSSEKTSPAQPFSAPAVQKSKSWSNQSSPGLGPSTTMHPSRLPGLGPVISPSKAKAKAGQTTTTHHASPYVPFTRYSPIHQCAYQQRWECVDFTLDRACLSAILECADVLCRDPAATEPAEQRWGPCKGAAVTQGYTGRRGRAAGRGRIYEVVDCGGGAHSY